MLPHYLVVAVFIGGAWTASTEWIWSSGGPVGLLVLFGDIVLLFTGRYPKSPLRLRAPLGLPRPPHTPG